MPRYVRVELCPGNASAGLHTKICECSVNF